MLIERDTVLYDQRYLAEDLAYVSLYFGVAVRQTRSKMHREITCQGTAVVIKPGALHLVNTLIGCSHFYRADCSIDLYDFVQTPYYSPGYKYGTVADDVLSQVTDYMYASD